MRASSSVVSQFLTAINLLVVLVLTPFMASAQSYDVSFIHTDHLGSPVAVTSVTGEVIWNAQFSAYGKEYQGTGTPAQDPIGFAGSSNDRQTGLVYMQARFYDPDIGRFLSVDPVGFTTDNVMSFNRYLYVNNNPYEYIDPDGEFLKAITTAVKVGYKAIKARKNPIKAIGEELVGAVDDAMTIFDGQWTVADLAATADLLIGTDLNNRATRTTRSTSIDTIDGGARSATQPNRIYSSRELQRRAENPRANGTPNPNHNFPESFNDEIFQGTRLVVSDNYVLYTKRGFLNGKSGTYEIGVIPSTSSRNEVITHRFFNPD